MDQVTGSKVEAAMMGVVIKLDTLATAFFILQLSVPTYRPKLGVAFWAPLPK